MCQTLSRFYSYFLTFFSNPVRLWPLTPRWASGDVAIRSPLRWVSSLVTEPGMEPGVGWGEGSKEHVLHASYSITHPANLDSGFD